MPNLYTSVDAGLPAIPAGSSYTLAKFTYLMDVLKACLVTGYGSKPAAGWEKVDEGSTFLVLKNASGKYVTFVCGYQLKASAAMYNGFCIFLSETYTGMTNDRPQELGVVTGIVSGNNTPQWWGGQYLGWTANQTNWWVVADDRTFIFNINAAGGTSYVGPQLDNNNQACGQCLYVGDTSDGNFIAVGGQNVTIASANNYVPGTGSLERSFCDTNLTLLKNPITGSLVDTGGVSASLQCLAAGASQNFPSGQSAFVVTLLELAKVRYSVGGSSCGYLRGLCIDPSLMRVNASVIRASIDGTTNYATMTIAQFHAPPSTLIDGHFYQPVISIYAWRNAALITDNPEFW